MVYIFYSLSCDRLQEESFNVLLHQLPSPIQTQVLKFRKWEDRQRSLFGKILLLTGLKSLGFHSYSLKDLKFTKFSRPYFDDLIDFNISHSGDYTICAISEITKIGVDVEEIKHIPLVGFEIQFSEKEWQNVLQDKDSLRSFYTLWTQKEAFLKAIGTGLNQPLNEVMINANRITWNGKEWFLREIELDTRHISYLCSDIFLPKISIERIDFQ